MIQIWLGLLMVRKLGFHPSNRSSILRRATMTSHNDKRRQSRPLLLVRRGLGSRSPKGKRATAPLVTTFKIFMPVMTYTRKVGAHKTLRQHVSLV